MPGNAPEKDKDPVLKEPDPPGPNKSPTVVLASGPTTPLANKEDPKASVEYPISGVTTAAKLNLESTAKVILVPNEICPNVTLPPIDPP